MTIVGIARVPGITTLDREDTHGITPGRAVGRATVPPAYPMPCPAWCPGGCEVHGLDEQAAALMGRLHEKTVAALTAPNAECGDPTDVQMFIERCDDTDDLTADTRVVLKLERRDLDLAGAADTVSRFTDSGCRSMLTAYFAGEWDRMSIALTPAQLRALAAAALEAADLAEQTGTDR